MEPIVLISSQQNVAIIFLQILTLKKFYKLGQTLYFNGFQNLEESSVTFLSRHALNTLKDWKIEYDYPHNGILNENEIFIDYVFNLDEVNKKKYIIENFSENNLNYISKILIDEHFIFQSDFEFFLILARKNNQYYPSFNFQQLKFRNKILKFNRIVSYGCSYTQGAELADHLILRYRDPSDVDESKRKTGTFPKGCVIWEDNMKREYESLLTYAGFLAKKFNVDHCSRGVAGYSLGQIVYDIILDLEKNVITQEDLILVGLTGVGRFFYFNEENQPISVLMNYDFTWPNKNFYKEMTLNYNEASLLYDYFQNLLILDYLNKVKLNNQLLVQPLHSDLQDEFKWLKGKKDNFIEIFRIMENLDFIINKDLSFGNLTRWQKESLHGFNHPKKIYHERLADSLYNTLTYENF